jgi:two-component system response regulator RegA
VGAVENPGGLPQERLRDVTHTVLVVDDDEIFCRSLRRALEARALLVHIENSMRTGLVAAADKRPDVIVLDSVFHAENESGLGALPAFRAVAPTSPIVMASAFFAESIAAAARACGATCYVEKGDSDLLVALICATAVRRPLQARRPPHPSSSTTRH